VFTEDEDFGHNWATWLPNMVQSSRDAKSLEFS